MSCMDIKRESDGIVVVVLDMPGRSWNVWNDQSVAALEAVIDELGTDEACTGVVITSGKAGGFLAGADLEMVQRLTSGAHDAAELMTLSGRLSRLLRRLETLGKPVVAAINGTALGGGFELALACHHRILVAAPAAKVGLPEVQLGLLPGAGGTQRLPRLIGVKAALQVMTEGKALRSDTALALGLVHELAPPSELLDRARAWLRSGPSPAQPWDVRGFSVPGGGLEAPEVGQVVMAGTAMISAKTQGNLPAPVAILSCVAEGLRLPMDAALLVETRHFVKLLLDPVAGNMVRTLFLAKKRADALVRRPAGLPRRRPQRVGVLGAGLMGAGIAYVCAKAGLEVVVLDLDEATARDKAHGYIAAREDKAIARKRSTPEKKQALLDRVLPVGSPEGLSGCDLVVEAVFENRELKAKLTAAVDAVLDAEAVFGSNTSTLPITGLATASSRPHRFIGLHFFSPVERMPLVEVIVGEQTDESTLAWALDFVAALRKTPIVVRDSRGFYTSRVFGTYVTEGMAMLREGVAPALIENAGKRAGMPMPPLALADEVGIQLLAFVDRQTRADLGAAAPEKPSTPVVEWLVEQGRRGRRDGGGFYDYAGRDKRLWAGLAERYPVATEQPEVQELVDRFLSIQAIEAVRCVEEGVITDPQEVDLGAILGWGFAPWTGGPLSYIDTIGIAAFVDRARAFAAAHGPRFDPPALLETLRSEGRAFHTAPS